MLTAALLGLTLPLSLGWGYSARPPIAGLYVEEGVLAPPSSGAVSLAFTLIGPSSLLADRAEFGRSTAAELMSYASLNDDWDHEGAIAPHPDSITDALRMLEVTPTEVGAPKSMVLASGDIALYWDFGETYAEIGFDGTGTYYAYASASGHNPVHLDDIALYGDSEVCRFPPAILEILSWEPFKAAA